MDDIVPFVRKEYKIRVNTWISTPDRPDHLLSTQYSYSPVALQIAIFVGSVYVFDTGTRQDT